jgi:hypothetical protein
MIEEPDGVARHERRVVILWTVELGAVAVAAIVERDHPVARPG